MPSLSESQRQDIKWAIDSLQERNPAYTLFSNYYAGNHKSLALASPEFNSAVSFVDGFCENLCATVVDVLKDRLKLTDFTHNQKEKTKVDAEIEETDPLAEKILEIWRLNRVDELQGEIYLETLKSGDGYAFVWPDENGDPAIDPNEASLVAVLYSDQKRGVIEKAAKSWITNDNYGRLNLYYPDRTEKFRTSNKIQGDFVNTRVEAYEPFETPIPNPYEQVPIFHFRNNAGSGKFGVSELKAAIPSQDRLNKTIIDGLVIGEEHAMPVRYALGFESVIDPTTRKPLLDWKPGDWFITRQKEATIGQLPAADLGQFVAAADDARQAIARVTRTPLHYFQQRVGVPPSGEALKTEEAPLTAKVKDRQTSFGNTWEDLFTFALKIVGVQDVRLEAVWANTEPRDAGVEIENQVQKVQHLGFSRQQALRELEYSDAEIAKIEAEKEDEGGEPLRTSDNGRVGAVPPPESVN